MKLSLQFGAQIESYEGVSRLTWPEGRRWYKADALSEPSILAFLVFMATPRSQDEALDELCSLTGATPAAAAVTIEGLVNSGLLSVNRDDEVFEAARMWSSYGWAEAFHFHLASESAERIDYSTPAGLREDVQRMKTYVEASQPPSHDLQLPSIQQIKLPDPHVGFDLEQAFNLRNVNDVGPMSPADLATLLFFALGVVGSKRLPVTGDHPRKAVPSGGSRHPTEAIVILDSSHGELVEGFYHYRCFSNSLDLLARDEVAGWVQENVIEIDEWIDFSPRVTIILFSMMARNRYRYRENFTYRPVHHDAGHVIEQLSLVLRSMGRRHFGGYSMNVEAFAEKVGLSSLDAPAIAFMAVE